MRIEEESGKHRRTSGQIVGGHSTNLHDKRVNQISVVG